MNRNFVAFLQTHFSSDFSSDLELARELIEYNVVNSMVVLLNKLVQTNSMILPELNKEEVGVILIFAFMRVD